MVDGRTGEIFGPEPKVSSLEMSFRESASPELFRAPAPRFGAAKSEASWPNQREGSDRSEDEAGKDAGRVCCEAENRGTRCASVRNRRVASIVDCVCCLGKKLAYFLFKAGLSLVL